MSEQERMMEQQRLLTNLRDAGCGEEMIRKAERLYADGDMKGLRFHLRRCRCELMAELHESWRKVDRLDNLIRQTEKKNL